MNTFDLITIIGPTASGKTSFACQLAHNLSTDIISGDSRQVYKNMDIGTGKDLEDYIVHGVTIDHHLIDICEAGYKYNLFEYQTDFNRVYNLIKSENKLPILCGGSGLYIESVLRGYNLINVPENKPLRQTLESKTLAELIDILSSYKTLHNTTDIDTAQRTIRAIEIEESKKINTPTNNTFSPLNSLIIGINIDREIRRKRITSRLHDRLNNGLIEEVKNLLNKGINPEDLIYYGLEYKFVTQYLLNELSYDAMYSKLEIAIHQFAKRQMTWFRGMEKRGLYIHWLDGKLTNEEKILLVKNWLK